MTNEVKTQSKETDKDNLNYPSDKNVRILEIVIQGEQKNESSILLDINKDIKQVPFSSIFKENENLKDESLYY